MARSPSKARHPWGGSPAIVPSDRAASDAPSAADGNVRDVAREALQGCHGFGAVMRKHTAEPVRESFHMIDVEPGHLAVLLHGLTLFKRSQQVRPLVELGQDDDQGTFVSGVVGEPLELANPRRGLVQDRFLTAQPVVAAGRCVRVPAAVASRRETACPGSGRRGTGWPESAPGDESPGWPSCPGPVENVPPRCRKGKASRESSADRAPWGWPA